MSESSGRVANSVTTAEGESAAPTVAQRLLVSVAIGLLAASATGTMVSAGASDFRFWHHATSLLWTGQNPYPLRPGDPAWPLPDPLFYPLPTLLVSTPFVHLPAWMAAALVLGASSGGLAWCLSRAGWHRLWFFAHPGFLMALSVGQWTPTLCLAAMVPSLGFLLSVKPNLGGPLFFWRPSRAALVGGIVLLAVSFVVMPSWVADWRTNLALLDKHPAPLFTWQGAWLWIAVLRWRSADARLLLMTAAVPQLLFFADQLPLALVARSRKESAWLAFIGLLAWLAWYASLHGPERYVPRAAPFVLAGLYAPALLLILRRAPEASQ